MSSILFPVSNRINSNNSNSNRINSNNMRPYGFNTSAQVKAMGDHKQVALYLMEAAHYHLEAARCNSIGEYAREKDAVQLACQVLSRVNEIQGEV